MKKDLRRSKSWRQQDKNYSAAGTAALIAEPVLALAHTGGVGVIVGLVVGAIAYNAVEDVERLSGREATSSSPDSQEADEAELKEYQEQKNHSRWPIGYSMGKAHETLTLLKATRGAPRTAMTTLSRKLLSTARKRTEHLIMTELSLCEMCMRQLPHLPRWDVSRSSNV